MIEGPLCPNPHHQALTTMICDSHCHLKHGDAAGTEYSAQRIVEIMDAAGVDRSVVFAIHTTSEEANAMTRKALAAFPERLMGYAYASPSFERAVVPDLERAVRDWGFKGIKVHCGEIGASPWVLDPVYELGGRLGVPVLVDFKGRLPAARHAAEQFPDTTILIAHMGAYLNTNRAAVDAFIDLAAQHPNLVLDTSGVVLTWKIGEAVRRVGSDRMTWGVDGPHPYPTPESYARSELTKIRTLELDQADERNLLGGTIARLVN